ncbi:hypothetical protein ACQP00_29345 [Dactylosporangium sp. CS-047395]|uniref:hypothetical protein n=1 Tax=Dactylosporangium sp. CS-047395 TaxID=3239936 RepID=UPI003D8D64BF
MRKAGWSLTALVAVVVVAGATTAVLMHRHQHRLDTPPYLLQAGDIPAPVRSVSLSADSSGDLDYGMCGLQSGLGQMNVSPAGTRHAVFTLDDGVRVYSAVWPTGQGVNLLDLALDPDTVRQCSGGNERQTLSSGLPEGARGFESVGLADATAGTAFNFHIAVAFARVNDNWVVVNIAQPDRGPLPIPIAALIAPAVRHAQTYRG